MREIRYGVERIVGDWVLWLAAWGGRELGRVDVRASGMRTNGLGNAGQNGPRDTTGSSEGGWLMVGRKTERKTGRTGMLESDAIVNYVGPHVAPIYSVIVPHTLH